MKIPALLLATLAFTLTLPGQDWAKAKLEKSPRHQEWVKVKQGNREVECFVVYPETKDKVTTVILIHENKGLTDWVRQAADEMAEAGYIAIAPDLLSGTAPGGGKTSDFPSADAATKGIYALPADQVTADLKAVEAYAHTIPAANGKVAVGGFCWGGGQTFRFATNAKDIKAAFVFYGPGPEGEADIARIHCPVYGFYGGNDSRIGATVPKSSELMSKAGKKYEPVTYDGAGHGFMRGGDDPAGRPADVKARNEAWQRLKGLLSKI